MSRYPQPITHADASTRPAPWYVAYLERRKAEVFIIGTNLRASTVARVFSGGFSYDEIRCVYSVSDDQIRACLCWWEDEDESHV